MTAQTRRHSRHEQAAPHPVACGALLPHLPVIVYLVAWSPASNQNGKRKEGRIKSRDSAEYLRQIGSDDVVKMQPFKRKEYSVKDLEKDLNGRSSFIARPPTYTGSVM